MAEERLRAISEGLTGQSAVLNIIGIIVICLIFIVLMYFGYQYQKNQIITATTSSMFRKKNRRRFTRVDVDIPVLLQQPDTSKSYEAKILDVSIGGVRLLTPVAGIAAASNYTLTKPESREFGILRNERFFVLWVTRNKDQETATMRGRWLELPKEKRSALQFRINEMTANIKESETAA